MLLGNFRTYSEASDDPVGFFRFNQYEAFASDNWRVNDRLSLELGVRYQFAPPIYSQQNNLVNFDPSLYDPAQAVRMNNNGTIVANSGYRFNGLVRAGDGIPEDQTGRVDLVTGGDFDQIPTGAPRGLYDGQHLFMPRFSGAYSIGDDGRTSVRGGIGLFYDRPQGNIIFSSVNLPPILQISQYENGNLGNPSGGTPSALAPLATISTIDPGLETAQQLQYSVSVQREVMDGYLFEVAYVGNKGRDLLWFPDINRVPFEVLAANNALPAAQRLSENALRPYKGYSAIQQRRSEGRVQLQRPAAVLQQAPRRLHLHGRLHAVEGGDRRQRLRRQPDRQRAGLQLRAGQLRSPARVRLDLDVPRAVPARSPRHPRLHAGRVGSQRHHACAVRSVPDRHRQHVDRQPPGRLRRRPGHRDRRRRREPVVQHRRLRVARPTTAAARPPSARSRARRTTSGTSRSARSSR